MQDFKRHLGVQLDFLRNSARAFDSGNKPEAIRIAVVLRVIFYRSTKSISLLDHLNALEIKIRSEAFARRQALTGRRVVAGFSWSLATMVLAPSGCRLEPRTDPSGPCAFVSATEWWNEVVSTLSGNGYTRAKIILWAANKDGGAHVDAKVPEAYAELRASGALGFFQIGGVQIPVEDAHLTLLRTMAFEVLNSPELLALAG